MGTENKVNKYKICIFGKRKSVCNLRWAIYQDLIDVVDECCYLGINLHRKGNLNKSVKILNERALKAFKQLLSVCSRLNLDIKTKLSLFDALVAPIIIYGSEIWGAYDIQEVDKLDYQFCKIVLGVRPQTSNAAVLGELGRVPLSVIARHRAVKYWIRVLQNPGSLIHAVYNKQRDFFNSSTATQNTKQF